LPLCCSSKSLKSRDKPERCWSGRRGASKSQSPVPHKWKLSQVGEALHCLVEYRLGLPHAEKIDRRYRRPHDTPHFHFKSLLVAESKDQKSANNRHITPLFLEAGPGAIPANRFRSSEMRQFWRHTEEHNREFMAVGRRTLS
jgi:hypothetical protein